MRGRGRLYTAFLLSTAVLMLLSWVNKHRLLPISQVRDYSSCTVTIVLYSFAQLDMSLVKSYSA